MFNLQTEFKSDSTKSVPISKTVKCAYLQDLIAGSSEWASKILVQNLYLYYK